MATAWLLPVERPAAIVPFFLGASSITSLLLYFYGAVSMGRGTRWMLLPALAALVIFLCWCRVSGRRELFDRVLAGLWAGALATFAYDVVRLPIVVAGTPVFKAISYFGTVILDKTSPTTMSDLVGWSYHFSNGTGFGLMCAVALARPSLWTAMVWGVVLELAMLATPYAEVFGYNLSPKFLAITVGSHLVYGAALWAALSYWQRGRGKESLLVSRVWKLSALGMLAPVGIGAVAWDFHDRHAASIPPSPPAYLGSHLYTTWNVLEPDRIALLWLTRRYVDPRARFNFVEAVHPHPVRSADRHARSRHPSERYPLRDRDPAARARPVERQATPASRRDDPPVRDCPLASAFAARSLPPWREAHGGSRGVPARGGPALSRVGFRLSGPVVRREAAEKVAPPPEGAALRLCRASVRPGGWVSAPDDRKFLSDDRSTLGRRGAGESTHRDPPPPVGLRPHQVGPANAWS